jgi:hypothetical protein
MKLSEFKICGASDRVQQTISSLVYRPICLTVVFTQLGGFRFNARDDQGRLFPQLYIYASAADGLLTVCAMRAAVDSMPRLSAYCTPF